MHLGVVIALQRDAVKVAEAVKEVGRHMAEIRRVADTIAEAIDHETMRAKVVMSEADRVTCDAVDRRESRVIEGSYKRHELWGARG